jgi:hypothetical protein
MTLRSLERGGTGVTIGAYLAVMQVLGIERDLDLLAQVDSTGHALQDARMSTRQRATRHSEPSTGPNPTERRSLEALPEKPSQRALANLPSAQPGETALESAGAMESLLEPRKANDWIEEGGFASSQTLANLIDGQARSSKPRAR